MEFLVNLWIPIIVAAVLAFIASSIIHMALPWHKGDCGKLPDEDRILDAMRSANVTPGNYTFPACSSMKDFNSPEMKEKIKRGPVGFITVVAPGGFNMNKSLIQWFVWLLVVECFIAYVAWHALPPGSAYLAVFRVTGTTAILGFALGVLNESIWKGQKWSITLKFVVDGVVYALLSAGVFGWLWPSPA